MLTDSQELSIPSVKPCLQFFTWFWRTVHFLQWLASCMSRQLFPSSLQVVTTVKEFCRLSILRGRAVPFLQKACAVHAHSCCGPMSLFFILQCFSSWLRTRESVLVADVKCTFLGDERWSLGSPGWQSHCMGVSQAVCKCFVRLLYQKNGHVFSFPSAPFQKGTGPVFKIDNVSTYCQGRIETVILIWHRHLFLTFKEALKSERRSGLTHSFHQLFLLLSCLNCWDLS